MESITAAASQTNFSLLDWIIVGVYLLVSLIIGLIVTRHISKMSHYLGAGRAVGTRLGIATMAGTEMGLITVMYSAQKGFTGGFAAFHIALAAGIVTLAVGMTGFIVYRLREMRVLTIPEFYEKRFGKGVRVLGGVMLVFGGVLNMGLFLQVGAKFIVGITGLSHQGWAVPTVMAVLLVLVLVYTVVGGLVSVVVTDYLQFVVLALGIFVATFVVIAKVGWTTIFTTVAEKMGERGFNPLVEGGGFGLEYVIWMFFTAGLVSCAIWPTAVARALAMESPEAVKRQYRWSAVSFMIRFLVPYFWGIGAFVFIVTQAPDLQAAFFPPEGSDQVALDNLYAMPIFMGRILPVGVIGLLTAAMIAAFMSTHDSYLLCWSSVITQDIVAPLCRNGLSYSKRLWITRSATILIGAYILYWGLFYKGNDDIWDYMAVSGAIYFTGAFALLFAGLYWKRASRVGALLALICGGIMVLGLSPVQEAVGVTNGTAWKVVMLLAEEGADGSFSIPGARLGWVSVCLTLAAMGVGSLVFPDKKEEQW